MKRFLLISSAITTMLASSASAAVLLTSDFGAGTDKTLVPGTGVTITSGISLVGINEQSENGNIRLQSGIAGLTFESGNDVVTFGIETTNAGEQFSLNSATSLIAFDNERVYGDVIGQRIVVYGGTDNSGPVLFTSPETSGNADNTHSGSFPLIVGSQLFFEIQYRNTVDNGNGVRPGWTTLRFRETSWWCRSPRSLPLLLASSA